MATYMTDIKLRENDFYTDTMYEAAPAMELHGEPADLASLFTKLMQVNKSVKMIGKTGKFNAGNTKYDYASQEDVIETVAPALAKAGLATIPSVVNVSWQDIPGKYGINRVCTVHMQILIADTDTGAYAIAHTFATAANGDKATSAAGTTALKYFLARLALTSFGDDGDEVTVDGTKAGKQGPKAKLLTKDERDKLTSRIKETGAGDAVKAWMKENAVTFSKLTDAQAKAIEVGIDAHVAMDTAPGTTDAT